MPTQKDFKRLVRSRMREDRRVVHRRASSDPRQEQPSSTSRTRPDFAGLAGMSDASVTSERAGRGPSGSPFSTPCRLPTSRIARSWRSCRHSARPNGGARWSRSATSVFADCGKKVSGVTAATKPARAGPTTCRSTTLFDAFLSARRRNRWLPVRVAVRSSALHKRMRIEWDDKTVVQVAFLEQRQVEERRRHSASEAEGQSGGGRDENSLG